MKNFRKKMTFFSMKITIFQSFYFLFEKSLINYKLILFIKQISFFGKL